MLMLNNSKTVEVNRNDLHAIAVPERGDRSERWKGVQHGELVDTVRDSLKEFGVEIAAERYGISKDGGSALFGELVLRGGQLETMRGMDYTMGLRHSNLSKFAIKAVLGANVLVCDNMVISGEFALSRKHTIGVDIRQDIMHGVNKFLAQASGGSIQKMKEDLARINVDQTVESRFLIQCGEKGVFSWSHLEKVHREWLHPSHDDFAPRNGWSLYNAANEIVKRYSPERQFYGVRQLEGLIKEAAFTS